MSAPDENLSQGSAASHESNADGDDDSAECSNCGVFISADAGTIALDCSGCDRKYCSDHAPSTDYICPECDREFCEACWESRLTVTCCRCDTYVVCSLACAGRDPAGHMEEQAPWICIPCGIKAKAADEAAQDSKTAGGADVLT